MWIPLGTGSEYKRKKNGRSLQQQCPQCNQFSTFYEIEKVDYISVFFIPILSHTKETDPTHNPSFECEKCGGTFIIKVNQQTNFSSNADWLKNFFNSNSTPEERAKAEAQKKAKEEALRAQERAKEAERKAQEEKRKAQDIEDALQRLKKEMQNKQNNNK